MGRTTLNPNQVKENTLEDADGNTKVQVEESSDENKIRFDTAGTERMMIDSNGRVGIGTSSPSTAFHVYADASNAYVATIDNDGGSSAHGLKVTTDGTGTGTTILDLEAASTTVFKVRGDGRVGIGVATPGSTLSVDDEIAVGEKLLHLGALHHTAGVHHAHLIACLSDYAQVVRDEHHRHAEVTLEFIDELQNLRLNGDV